MSSQYVPSSSHPPMRSQVLIKPWRLPRKGPGCRAHHTVYVHPARVQQSAPSPISPPAACLTASQPLPSGPQASLRTATGRAMCTRPRPPLQSQEEKLLTNAQWRIRWMSRVAEKKKQWALLCRPSSPIGPTVQLTTDTPSVVRHTQWCDNDGTYAFTKAASPLPALGERVSLWW